jgi:phospholipid/cholesterol/gamma-HCH transport system substrate-binding protein
MRRNHSLGMPPLRAGLLTILLAAVVTYFGFTKAVPFQHHFEIQAVVKSSNLLRPHSPVRIAGVNVGEVVRMGRYKHTNLSVLTLRINENGRPIHRDATLKVRPRLFLEGNFYVDLKPGTPSAGTLDDRGLIPITQTGTPVQLDQVLTALQSDTRLSLQRTVQGLGTALNGKPTAAQDAVQNPAVRGLTGAQALNKTLDTSPKSLQYTAQVAGALLGPHPHDLSKTIHGLTRVMTAVADQQDDLVDFVTDFNTTLGTTAAHAADLETSVDELGPTAQHAAQGFRELNAGLPAARQFARNLTASLPELPATIAAAGPWLTQARAALGKAEVGGLLDRLQPATKNLASLGHELRAWLPNIDALNRCVTNVLLPTGDLKVDDGALSANTENYKEFWTAAAGLAGESQFFDGNGSYLRLQAAHGTTPIVTGKTNFSNFPFTGEPTLPPLSTRPAYGNKLPPKVRSVPCASSPVPTVNDAASTGPPDGASPNAPAPDDKAVDGGGAG